MIVYVVDAILSDPREKWEHILSMCDLDAPTIVGPQVQLHHTNPAQQSCFDGLHTSITAQLIPCQIWVMARENEIVCQWLCHILIHLQSKYPQIIKQTNAKNHNSNVIRNCSKLQTNKPPASSIVAN